MDDEDTAIVITFIIGLFVGLIIAGFIFVSTIGSQITLNKETANELCTMVTNDTSSVANSNNNGKLECIIPSYDSTTNIIIKRAGE